MPGFSGKVDRGAVAADWKGISRVVCARRRGMEVLAAVVAVVAVVGAACWTWGFRANSAAGVAASKAAGVAVPEGAGAESADGANPYRLSSATEADEPGDSDGVDGVDGVDKRGDRPGLPHAN